MMRDAMMNDSGEMMDIPASRNGRFISGAVRRSACAEVGPRMYVNTVADETTPTSVSQDGNGSVKNTAPMNASQSAGRGTPECPSTFANTLKKVRVRAQAKITRAVADK